MFYKSILKNYFIYATIRTNVLDDCVEMFIIFLILIIPLKRQQLLYDFLLKLCHIKKIYG